MPKDDDDLEKWRMREHTEVKHEILEKYLSPWVKILSSTNSAIVYCDGFAGRGEYKEGEPTSPLIAMDAADRNLSSPKVNLETFYCFFIEKNENNYRSLKEAVHTKQKNCRDEIDAYVSNTEFAEYVEDKIDKLKRGDGPPPSFYFIDPFGYKGIPFDVISEILNLRDSGIEIFLTFMVRDIRRFMKENDQRRDTITDVFGTDEWISIAEENPENKEEELLKLYEEQLKSDAGVEYVWPFEVNMPERSETVYYLIHATNHFKGFKIMKDTMYRAGAEDKFAYLGPEHYLYDEEQKKLFSDSNSKVSDLADYLYTEFEKEEKSMNEIIRSTYTDTKLIDKHYREAIRELENRNKVEVINKPNKKEGTKNGLNSEDVVKFSSPQSGLDSF